MKKFRRDSWLNKNQHERDYYVNMARHEGWRSRSVFKLKQINSKVNILHPDMICIDLGSSPGGWSQYVSTYLKKKVKIIAVDLLPMDTIPSVEFIQGDITQKYVFNGIMKLLKNTKAGLVMSDIAPNITGVRSTDQSRSIQLAELSLDLASKLLKRKGNFICKLFQGEGCEEFIDKARKSFIQIKIIKPAASRPKSREIYFIGKHFCNSVK